MDKKGGMVMVLLLMLVVIVITIAVVLLLVRAEVIAVRPEYGEVPLLDAEFVPVGGEGVLVVKEFQFCGRVNEQYQCLEPKETFTVGEEVHFQFTVESSTFNQGVIIIENYRLLDPQGRIILDLDSRPDFLFEAASQARSGLVAFHDYFLTGQGLVEGEYTLELHLENPLIGKKVTAVKNFKLA